METGVQEERHGQVSEKLREKRTQSEDTKYTAILCTKEANISMCQREKTWLLPQ